MNIYFLLMDFAHKHMWVFCFRAHEIVLGIAVQKNINRFRLFPNPDRKVIQEDKESKE